MLNRDEIRGYICAIESRNHHLARPHPLYDQCLQEMSDCLVHIEVATGKEQTKPFLHKLQLKGLKFDKEQFIQDSCEITLAGHFAHEYPSEFTYEKQSSEKKDVDFSFSLKGLSINVEVKCPTPTEATPDTVSVQFFDRMPDRCKLVEGISNALKKGDMSASEKKREDLKLKDFLTSASEKFRGFDSGDTNVLAICCDDEIHMQEYRNYLLRTNPVLDSLPFDLGLFPRVHYVQLTNLGHRHRAIYSNQFRTKESPWLARRALSLLYANHDGKLSPATGNIATAFMSRAEDFEQRFSSGELVPDGESAILLPMLGLAWYSDNLRTRGAYYFAQKRRRKHIND